MVEANPRAAPTLTSRQVGRFRAGFHGEVIRPGQDAYDAARRTWNALWDRRPALIVRPSDAGDVAAAIRFGRERDLPLAVRGGGHGAAGHGSIDDGLLIDLAGINEVTVDPERRTARVGGGALLSQLDAAAQAHGLVCPVGIVGHTGVGGLTLGGGNGRLQRKLGMTIDSLLAVELVTADGRHVRASAEEEPDLFWAVRGAGANLGIVTAFEFDLHPFDGRLIRGVRIYDGRDVVDVWQRFREFAVAAPDELSLTFAIGSGLPTPDEPEGSSRPMALYGFNFCGDPADAERAAAPLLAGPEPVTRTGGPIGYLEVQAMNDEPMAWGHRSYIHGAMVDDLRPETLEALVEHAVGAPGDGSFGVQALGGAIGRVVPEATAYPGRVAGFGISADALWDDGADDERAIGWVRRAMEIAEVDACAGRYVNEMTEPEPGLARSIYGDAIYDRIAEVKRRWDPTNVFRWNHNVPPAPA